MYNLGTKNIWNHRYTEVANRGLLPSAISLAAAVGLKENPDWRNWKQRGNKRNILCRLELNTGSKRRNYFSAVRCFESFRFVHKRNCICTMYAARIPAMKNFVCDLNRGNLNAACHSYKLILIEIHFYDALHRAYNKVPPLSTIYVSSGWSWNSFRFAI